MQAALEQLRADAKEELDLQRETFEARIEELEACAASEFDGKADSARATKRPHLDVVAVLCAAALRGAGVDDATSLSAELARETTKDASIRLEAAVASSKAPATGGDLDKLRAQFEAARKARDQEASRLREEAASARSLAATSGRGRRGAQARDNRARRRRAGIAKGRQGRGALQTRRRAPARRRGRVFSSSRRARLVESRPPVARGDRLVVAAAPWTPPPRTRTSRPPWGASSRSAATTRKKPPPPRRRIETASRPRARI